MSWPAHVFAVNHQGGCPRVQAPMGTPVPGSIVGAGRHGSAADRRRPSRTALRTAGPAQDLRRPAAISVDQQHRLSSRRP